MAMSRRRAQTLALLFVDLDRFKPINDSLGHQVGDLVLKEVGARMQEAVRETDTVARIGGDEFVVILEEVGGKEAIVRVTQNILTSLQRPIAVEEHEFVVTASIGITLYPRDARDADGLLHGADLAMYEAKQEGGNRFLFYCDAHAAVAQ